MSILTVDRETVRLFAAADAVAILAFVLAGEYQHSMLAYDAANPLRFVAVVAPFAVAWVVAAPLLRAYGPGARSWRGLFGWTLLSWLGADVLAQILLLSGVFPIGFDPVFAAVVAGFGTLFLWIARSAALLASRR